MYNIQKHMLKSVTQLRILSRQQKATLRCRQYSCRWCLFIKQQKFHHKYVYIHIPSMTSIGTTFNQIQLGPSVFLLFNKYKYSLQFDCCGFDSPVDWSNSTGGTVTATQACSKVANPPDSLPGCRSSLEKYLLIIGGVALGVLFVEV